MFSSEENSGEVGYGEWQGPQHLKFETVAEDRDHVAILRCAVFSRFWERFQPIRNYTPVLIDGTSNVLSFTFKDHTKTDMHKHTMVLFKKVQSSGSCDYAPIMRAVAQSSMDADSTTKIKQNQNGVHDS